MADDLFGDVFDWDIFSVMRLIEMLKKLVKKLKDRVKENQESKKKDKEWQDSIREEAKVEAREEAKDDLKKLYKDEEKARLLKKKENPLQKLGNEFKGTGLGSDDKINRLLGGRNQEQSGSFNSRDKISRILEKKQTSYGDVIENNKVIMTSKEQELKAKEDRIKRMLG